MVSEPGGNRALEPTQVLSARTSEGWGVEDLVTPHERGEGLKIGEAPEYRSFSEDLALGLVQTPAASAAEPLEAPPLAPGSSEKTLYVRDDPSLSPEPEEANAYQAAQANQGYLAPGYRAAGYPRTGHERNPAGGKDPVRWTAYVRGRDSGSRARRLRSGRAAALGVGGGVV